MKYARIILFAGAALGLIGCASASKVATALGPVGPGPLEQVHPSEEGSLQVYSARLPSDVDVNAATFYDNSDFGRNDFLYQRAHSDYTILSQDGRKLRRVCNSRDRSDAQPALVTLPAGSYEVEAQAEVGGTTVTVVLAIRIVPGERTVAHLGEGWRPRTRFNDSQVVRLPDGQIVGWRPLANEPIPAQVKTSS